MGAYKTEPVTLTLNEALEQAAGELISLHDEMNDWRDSLEDKFSGTEKYEQVSEAADLLSAADGLDDAAHEIIETLELLAKGRQYRAPCGEHVIGTPCMRCGWDGAGRPNPKAARTFVETPPRPLGADPGLLLVGGVRQGGIYYCAPNPERARQQKVLYRVLFFDSVEEARAALEAFTAEQKRQFPPVAAPRRAEQLALAQLAGVAELAAKPITCAQEVPTRKNRAPSRNVRLSNAISLGQTAVEALREGLSTLQPAEGEQEELISDIEAHLDTLHDAFEECESVEFPGMF